MTSGKQFTPDPGVYAEMSEQMRTAMPFPSLLGAEGKRIVAWLREQYETSAKAAEIPINAISMIDTLRKLIEEGAHLEPAALAQPVEAGEDDEMVDCENCGQVNLKNRRVTCVFCHAALGTQP